MRITKYSYGLMMVHGRVGSRVWLLVEKNKAQTFVVIQIPNLKAKLASFISSIKGASK